jgi:hypothetical protein
LPFQYLIMIINNNLLLISTKWKTPIWWWWWNFIEVLMYFGNNWRTYGVGTLERWNRNQKKRWKIWKMVSMIGLKTLFNYQWKWFLEVYNIKPYQIYRLFIAYNVKIILNIVIAESVLIKQQALILRFIGSIVKYMNKILMNYCFYNTNIYTVW